MPLSRSESPRETEPTTLPPLSLVAAVAHERVIGKDNRLPWRLPEDLKRFKQLTLGHAVIMGRKTFESIIQTTGRPLPGRENIVVTRSLVLKAPGCRVAASIEAAIVAAREAAGEAEAFVIGGAELYRLALPLASRMHLTEIDAEFDGDAWFPAFDPAEWRETARESRVSSDDLLYHFVTYVRR